MAAGLSFLLFPFLVLAGFAYAFAYVLVAGVGAPTESIARDLVALLIVPIALALLSLVSLLLEVITAITTGQWFQFLVGLGQLLGSS